MSRILLAMCLIAALTGCSNRRAVPSSRLHQPSGNVSYVTPDGWSRTKLAGVDFIIVWTESDAGARPSLYVDFVTPGTSTTDAAAQLAQTYRTDHRAYQVIHTTRTATASGLECIKVTAKRESAEGLPLATFHYLFGTGDRVIAITATCAATVVEQYEPIFDEAMKSLAAEGDSP